MGGPSMANIPPMIPLMLPIMTCAGLDLHGMPIALLVKFWVKVMQPVFDSTIRTYDKLL